MKNNRNRRKMKTRKTHLTHLEVDVLHILHVKAHGSPGGGEVSIQLSAIVLKAAVGKTQPWVYLPSSSCKDSTLHVVVVLIVGEVVEDVAIWGKEEQSEAMV